MNNKLILFVLISALSLKVNGAPGKLSPQFRKGYTFFEKTKLFLKLHIETTSFEDAMNICQREDAELAYWDGPEKQLSFMSISMNNSVWIGAYIQNSMIFSSNAKNIDEFALAYPIPIHNYAQNYGNIIRICTTNGEVMTTCPQMMSFICSKTLNPNVDYSSLNNSTPFFRNDYTYIKKNGYAVKKHSSRSWSEAIRVCEDENAELLTIDEDDDVSELTSMLDEESRIWIGASDLLVESKYETINGEPLTKTINIIFGHCIALNDTGFYETVSCTENIMFLCQKRFETYNFECDTVDIEYQKISGNGKCVKYHKEPKTWHDALETCKVENATLFVINHQSEAAMLSENLSKLDNLGAVDNHFDPFDHSILHIGFHDLFIEGMYRTMNGDLLKDSGYEVWSSFYPKLYMGLRCGGMVKGGTLQNGPCDVPALFACQKKK